MRNTHKTQATTATTKRDAKRWMPLAVAALAVALLGSTLLTTEADASLDDAKFCIAASGFDGSYKGKSAGCTVTEQAPTQPVPEEVVMEWASITASSRPRGVSFDERTDTLTVEAYLRAEPGKHLQAVDPSGATIAQAEIGADGSARVVMSFRLADLERSSATVRVFYSIDGAVVPVTQRSHAASINWQLVQDAV